MVLYRESKLGPTPTCLPIFFAICAIAGLIISTWLVFTGKISRLSFIVTAFFYLLSIFIHIKLLGEIIYVT